MSENLALNELNVGILIVAFDTDVGPKIKFAKSELSDQDEMFLGLKGYTALMIGVEYEEDHGRIRGSLSIPNTDMEAIAFDLIFKEDKDEKKSNAGDIFSPHLLFLILNQVSLQIARPIMPEIEEFLRKETVSWKKASEIKENDFFRLKKRFEGFLKSKMPKEVVSNDKSLYNISLLLQLPIDMRDTAQIILGLHSVKKNSITFEEIIEKSNLEEDKLRQSLSRLVQRGLIRASLHGYEPVKPK